MNKKRLILLVIIIIGVWYFWGRGQKVDGPTQEGAQVEETGSGADHNAPQPPLTLRGGDVGEGKARVHYFTKEALASCATETVAVELAVDPKYGHRAAGALVAMTLPMSAEQVAQYGSALPVGTRLLTMRIDEEEVAHADYNSALGTDAAECVKLQRRAQIGATLREFPEIKAVQITVEGVQW